MFKPVRIVAAIVFLAMIAMIFISAFLLNNGTLCISESPPLHFLSPFLALCSSKGCSLRRARVPRVPLVYAIVYPLCAHGNSQSFWDGIMLSPRYHHTYHFPILVTDHVVTSNLFLNSTLVSGYINSCVVATLLFILPDETLPSSFGEHHIF
jgi:hypothetical protein